MKPLKAVEGYKRRNTWVARHRGEDFEFLAVGKADAEAYVKCCPPGTELVGNKAETNKRENTA
jgi:hypothetical protein